MRGQYLYKLLRNVLHGFIIYSILYLCHYELMDICYRLWVIIQCYIISLPVQIVSALVIKSSSIDLLCSFHIPSSFVLVVVVMVFEGLFVCLFVILVFCFVFSTFLLHGTTKFSRLILCISCPSFRISHFSMEPGSFQWRIVVGTKIWTLVYLVFISCCRGYIFSNFSLIVIKCIY